MSQSQTPRPEPKPLPEAVTAGLTAFTAAPGVGFVELDIETEPGDVVTSDGVVTALRERAATWAPPLDLAALSVQLRWVEPRRARFIVEGLRRK